MFKNAYVITGSVASGKSQVCRFLRENGFKIIDADEISHEILQICKNEVVSNFGKNILSNGKIDRKKLGEIVFSDPQKLRVLEGILHPKIRDEIYAQAKELELLNSPYFVEIPLFFESGNFDDFKNVIVVFAPKEMLISRLMKRNNLDEMSANSRVALQIDIEKKREMANFVIDNSKDKSHLEAQIREFLAQISKPFKCFKFNANGNDFVIFSSDKMGVFNETARQICASKTGIGADGLIAICQNPEFDFEWDFYNSDGSPASMCGNGARAAAMFAYKKLKKGKRLKFKTGAGVINAQILDDISAHECLVEILFTTPKILQNEFEDFGRKWEIYDTGVPHLVTFVQDLNEFDVELARKMRQKYNANVNFAQSGETLRVRTYERGVEAETLACGTGMAACFFANFRRNEQKRKMTVIPTGGDRLNFRLEEGRIFYSGVVRETFEANFFIKES